MADFLLLFVCFAIYEFALWIRAERRLLEEELWGMKAHHEVRFRQDIDNANRTQA